jgi:hypothetical protein
MIFAVIAVAAAMLVTAVVGWRMLGEIHDFDSLSRRVVGDPAALADEWPAEAERSPGWPPNAA